MEFLLSHWHCILPIVAIPIALLLLKDKSGDIKSEQKNGMVNLNKDIEK